MSISNMKMLKHFLFLSTVTAVCCLLPVARCYSAVADESKIFTPYFNMSLSEGVYVPSKGDFFSGGGIDTQVGLLAKTAPKHSFLGLYGLRYAGPGFQPQDSRQFQERSLAHSFNLEYRRELADSFKFRPGVAYTREFKRTGAGELWENGLYNMNSFGGQLAVDYAFD